MRAQDLWITESAKTIKQQDQYVRDIKFTTDDFEHLKFAQAQRDEHNPGMHDDQGNRLPPRYVNHVDDLAYCDVKCFMARTVACSIRALNEVFEIGRAHV